jgi:hypothetical protein
VLRKRWAAAEDGSVVIVQVGSHELVAVDRRRYHDPLGGRELPRAGALLSAMRGSSNGKPEYNAGLTSAARKCFPGAASDRCHDLKTACP